MPPRRNVTPGLTIVPTNAAKPKPTRQPKPTPNTKRLTLVLDADLHADLEALAEEQRRELKQQCLHILETAVKTAKGQKRSRAQRASWRPRIDEQ